MQRESSVYELYSVQNQMIKKPSLKIDDDDDETTIDEVIEELRNIINDAETETLNMEEQEKVQNRKSIEQSQIASKIQMTVAVDTYSLNNEIEIIPSNLHPPPPRRTKSLVHLFIPAEDYDYGNKELFFENETAFTSEEGSDSLLSTSKYQLQNVDDGPKFCRNYSKNRIKRFDSFRQSNAPLVLAEQHNFKNNSSNNRVAVTNETLEEQKKIKSKSLDRIDDGLDTMVDIVMTETFDKDIMQSRTKSDSGVSHVFTYQNRLNYFNEEKSKMFLPSAKNRPELLCYFPRVQEKKSNSFLIKRGHTNAGLYSGQITRQHISPVLKSRECLSNSNKSSEKVTDFPSGLY